MEHNELDKIFREQLEQDSIDLNYEELQSKESVWNGLEINKEEKAPIKKLTQKRWWLLAAALLLLAFGASTIGMLNRLKTQTVAYDKMEKEYDKVAKEFLYVKKQLQTLDQKMEVKMQEEINQIKESVALNTEANPQIVEKIIYSKDTIYSIQKVEQKIEQIVKTEYIRDTVFIKLPVAEKDTQEIMIAESSEISEGKILTKNTQPSKVEFIINNKSTLETPKTEKFSFKINGTNVVRKN